MRGGWCKSIHNSTSPSDSQTYAHTSNCYCETKPDANNQTYKTRHTHPNAAIQTNGHIMQQPIERSVAAFDRRGRRVGLADDAPANNKPIYTLSATVRISVQPVHI